LVFEHELGEDQIDDLRHVDAGVEHVDRDGDVRRLVRLRECVDQRLRVRQLGMNDARERAFVVEVILVEALADVLSVQLIFGEDDGLAEAIATLHALVTSHQVFEHLVDRVLVEQPWKI
jgi:hypothetical protein